MKCVPAYWMCDLISFFACSRLTSNIGEARPKGSDKKPLPATGAFQSVFISMVRLRFSFKKSHKFLPSCLHAALKIRIGLLLNLGPIISVSAMVKTRISRCWRTEGLKKRQKIFIKMSQSEALLEHGIFFCGIQMSVFVWTRPVSGEGDYFWL